MTRYGHRQTVEGVGAETCSRPSGRTNLRCSGANAHRSGLGAERIYGSARFLSLTRRTDLPSPSRFEPTKKSAGDIVI